MTFFWMTGLPVGRLNYGDRVAIKISPVPQQAHLQVFKSDAKKSLIAMVDFDETVGGDTLTFHVPAKGSVNAERWPAGLYLLKVQPLEKNETANGIEYLVTLA
jgi:hypothetical protein